MWSVALRVEVGAGGPIILYVECGSAGGGKMRRHYPKFQGRGHRRSQNCCHRSRDCRRLNNERWLNNERSAAVSSCSAFANVSTSAGTSSVSSTSSSAPDLPGFYYDPEKNRYFRLLPGHNNCNPLTTEGILKRVMEVKRLKHLEEDKNRKKSSRLGCNASLLLRKQQIGLLPSTTYCRRMHELKVSCMQKKDVSIVNPEPLAEDTHTCEFIVIDSSGQRLFSVNDLDNGYCKYGLLELNGLWKDIPTVENHETLFFSNQKVTTACWASMNVPDSHVLICFLGKPSAPGRVSLIPASRFGKFEDDISPEVVYNFQFSSAWTSAWCSNPQMECTFAAGLQNQVVVLNINTDIQCNFRTNSAVLAQQFASQTPLLYNGCRSGEVFSIDLRVPHKNWKKGISFSQNSSIACLRLLNDENYMVVSDMSGQIKLWDLRMVKPVRSYEGHVNSYACLPVHVKEDEGLLLAVGQDCYTRIWNFQDARLLRSIPSPYTASKEFIPNVAFSAYHGGKRPVPGLLMAVKTELYHFTYDSRDF
ncbi:DDB1- and CUL4-associated factor 4 isoform X2 [Dendrobates tinctorius]|uniref:DDB1- and CUL4-associated factor 4 isoform X2 n=1 Tax=Dendrobates tinctorius TaxID=92724 RepID=UPI003CC9D740